MQTNKKKSAHLFYAFLKGNETNKWTKERKESLRIIFLIFIPGCWCFSENNLWTFNFIGCWLGLTWADLYVEAGNYVKCSHVVKIAILFRFLYIFFVHVNLLFAWNFLVNFSCTKALLCFAVL